METFQVHVAQAMAPQAHNPGDWGVPGAALLANPESQQILTGNQDESVSFCRNFTANLLETRTLRLKKVSS